MELNFPVGIVSEVFSSSVTLMLPKMNPAFKYGRIRPSPVCRINEGENKKALEKELVSSLEKFPGPDVTELTPVYVFPMR